jgi:polyisoprenoid-binding protein YceI
MTGTILLALVVLQAQAPGAQTWALDPAKSAIRFHLDHALHAVDGEAKVIEAKAVLGPDGQLRTMARVQVAGLSTGDANRDANMRAVMESDRHPYVVLKGTSTLARPAAAGAVPLPLKAELDLHGVKRPVDLPMQVTFAADGTARVQGSFDVSLEAHRIERPSLLFRKVDDACRVTVDLVLAPEKS